MCKREGSLPDRGRKGPSPGRLARVGRQTLRSVKMGALPIINRILQRLRLEEFLREHLPAEEKRVKVPTARALLVLVGNLLVSREPLYGIGEWAAGYAPDLLGLTPEQLQGLNDDGVGRALNWLFRSEQPTFVLAVVRHTVREFAVTLDQLHNDSRHHHHHHLPRQRDAFGGGEGGNRNVLLPGGCVLAENE